MERVLELKRGRSRRIRRPVEERSMALRRRFMKNGWAVVSPTRAMRSSEKRLAIDANRESYEIRTTSSGIQISHDTGANSQSQPFNSRQRDMAIIIWLWSIQN
jgi:hypothetical protein